MGSQKFCAQGILKSIQFVANLRKGENVLLSWNLHPLVWSHYDLKENPMIIEKDYDYPWIHGEIWIEHGNEHRQKQGFMVNWGKANFGFFNPGMG